MVKWANQLVEELQKPLKCRDFFSGPLDAILKKGYLQDKTRSGAAYSLFVWRNARPKFDFDMELFDEA